jgi:hypothetical protein
VGAAPVDDSLVIQATDDTYVVADVAAPDDPQGLRDKAFGGLDFIKVWYASQVQSTEQVLSVGLVKFDLSALRDREVRTAHLQMFAVRADLLQPVRLVDVSVAEGPWAEGDANFKAMPQLTTPPLASAAVYGANVWYSWDVTPAVVRWAQNGNVAYAVGLRSLEQKGEEQVVFAAHEAGRNAPRLVVTLAPAAPAIPLVAVPIGIVAAALLAFAGGIFVARRRSAPARAAAAPAQATRMARSRDEDTDDIVDCPACGRPIPAVAQTCPRCGVRIVALTEEREAVGR